MNLLDKQEKIDFFLSKLFRYLEFNGHSFVFNSPYKKHYIDLSLNEGLTGIFYVAKSLKKNKIPFSDEKKFDQLIEDLNSNLKIVVNGDVDFWNDQIKKFGLNINQIPKVYLGTNRGFYSLINILEGDSIDIFHSLISNSFESDISDMDKYKSVQTAYSMYGGISGYLFCLVKYPAGQKLLGQHLEKLISYYTSYASLMENKKVDIGGMAWGVEGILYTLSKLAIHFNEFLPIFIRVYELYSKNIYASDPVVQGGICHGYAGRLLVYSNALKLDYEKLKFISNIELLVSDLSSYIDNAEPVKKMIIYCCGMGSIVDVLEQLVSIPELNSDENLIKTSTKCRKLMSEIFERYSDPLTLSKYFQTTHSYQSMFTMSKGVVGLIYPCLRMNGQIESIYSIK